MADDVILGQSEPYNLNIDSSLSQESLKQINPYQLELSKFQRGTPLGAKTTQQYIEGALSPEMAKEQWSKNLQFRKEQLANEKILGQEKIELGKMNLDIQESIYKSQLIGKTISDSIKMAAIGFAGYQTNKPIDELEQVINAGTESDLTSIGMGQAQSFWKTQWGGALQMIGASMINPMAFGSLYASHYKF